MLNWSEIRRRRIEAILGRTLKPEPRLKPEPNKAQIGHEMNGRWTLELRDKDGVLLYRSAPKTKREIVSEFYHAMHGDMPVPHYPWQTTVTVRFQGDGCPNGDHEHPEQPRFSWETYGGDVRGNKEVLDELEILDDAG